MKKGFRRSYPGYVICGYFGFLLLTLYQNKELEATEERKRKAKQLEMQRKEVSRSGRNAVPRTPVYPTYTAPSRPAVTDTYDSYEAEKNKSYKLVHLMSYYMALVDDFIEPQHPRVRACN